MPHRDRAARPGVAAAGAADQLIASGTTAGQVSNHSAHQQQCSKPEPSMPGGLFHQVTPAPGTRTV